jgi:hypothetical protein
MASSETDQDETPSGSALLALRDLVQSDGWQLLTAYARAQWGPEGYGRRMQAAIATVPHDADRPFEIARVAQEVDAVARAVNEIVAWPESQIRALAPKPESRRPFHNLRRTS